TFWCPTEADRGGRVDGRRARLGSVPRRNGCHRGCRSMVVHGLHPETGMSNLEKSVTDDGNALRQMRGELPVRLHLGAEDAKGVWDELERKWFELEDRAKQVARATDHSADRAKDAARLLVSELRDGYDRIKRAL